MFTFRHHLHQLIAELKKGSSLKRTSQGEWTVKNNFVSKVVSLFSPLMYRWVEMSKGLRQELEELESEPILLNSKDDSIVQPIDYKKYIIAAELMLGKLQCLTSSIVVEEHALLKKTLVGLLYRLGKKNGGLDPENISEELFDQIKTFAFEWKKTEITFDDRHLTSVDLKILQETCRYPLFAELLVNNMTVREEFFTWALRDAININAFIQYPGMANKINHVKLNGRIGRMGGHLLKVQTISVPEHVDVQQKVLTLPFEGRDISILDEKRVVMFRGNYGLTVGEIFHIFWNKTYSPGNLEFMADGIINWHSHYWGYWDEDRQDYELVDFNKSEWWNQLPIHEILTLREARTKFGTHLDGKQWNFAAISTRETETLDYYASHAYTSLAIPDDQGRYLVYTFGKYAFKFPKNFFEAAMNLGETSDATIAYPDENVYYTHRQKGRYSFGLTPKQGLVYFDSIRRDMILSREGNFVYQIESENCAKWSQLKIEEILGSKRIPNLYQMPFLDSQPHGFMAQVFSIVKIFPSTWQAQIAIGLHFPFGSYKGKWIWEEGKRIWRGLTNHSFWEDEIIYHPAMLYKQKELGLIGQSMAVGVTFSGQVLRKSYRELQERLEDFGLMLTSSTARRVKWILKLVRETYLRVITWFVPDSDGSDVSLGKSESTEYKHLSDLLDEAVDLESGIFTHESKTLRLGMATAIV